MKFRIGDRVVAINAVDGNTGVLNKVGTVTIVNAHSTYSYGIVFDKFVGGHSLDGSSDVEYGHGWWCEEKDLQLCEFKPGIPFEELMIDVI